MGVWTSRPARCFAALMLLAVAIASQARAADDSDAGRTRSEQLAREVQNPFSGLLTVPIQSSTAFGYSPDDGLQNETSLQPIVPFRVTNDWEILVRPILPLDYTSLPTADFGLGDVTLEAMISPASASDLEWGAGFILSAPTASRESLGFGKWTAGPFVGVYAESGAWTFSLAVSQQWSFAGSGQRDAVSFLQIQPTVNYNFGGGWYAIFAPPITGDFSGPGSGRWFAPVGGGLGKIFDFGRRSVAVSVEGYRDLVRSDGVPRGAVILTLTLVLPE